MQSTKTLAQLKCSVPLKIGSGGLTAVNNNSASILNAQFHSRVAALEPSLAATPGGFLQTGDAGKTPAEP